MAKCLTQNISATMRDTGVVSKQPPIGNYILRVQWSQAER